MRALARTPRGFTLIEQIVTLAISAILLGLAIPAMRGLLRRQHARTALQSLVQAVRTARMLSIERQRRSLLCPSVDGRHCSGDGAWEHGWLVALDSNHDGQPDTAPRITHPAPGGVRILASRGRSRIYYHPDGSAPGSNLTLRVCPLEHIPARVDALVVSNAGRIRVMLADAAPCRAKP